MAFVMMFTGWEEFLEDTFEYYLISDRKIVGRTQKVQVVDLGTARDVIRGTRPYVEWSDANQVRQRAKIFFRDGEPYETVLSSISSYLDKMRVIRNRCVHCSQHAADQYEKVIRQILGSGKKFVPGQFLLFPPPASLLPPGKTLNYNSTFELFAAVLMTACSQIAPVKKA